MPEKNEHIGVYRVGKGQGSRALRVIVNEVQTILTQNENVLYIACQGISVASQRKDAVVATNNRLILYYRHWFGRASFDDYLWEDIQDVDIFEGVLSSTVTCTLVNGNIHSIGNLRKRQTRTLYSISQQKEQEWRERRRVRDIEEERARAGGTQITMPAAGEADSDGTGDPVARLTKAKEMFDRELISEVEYETLKANILQTM